MALTEERKIQLLWEFYQGEWLTPDFDRIEVVKGLTPCSYEIKAYFDDDDDDLYHEDLVHEHSDGTLSSDFNQLAAGILLRNLFKVNSSDLVVLLEAAIEDERRSHNHGN